MEYIIEQAKKRFALENCRFSRIAEHEGGRNQIYICERPDGDRKVLRVSRLNDRTEEAYLAETEFIRYLAENGASVADVCPSDRGKYVERLTLDGQTVYLSLFTYAPGMLISDNGYRYREGAPLSEYFYNTGKTLGQIHRLAKNYRPLHCRADYFDKYNRDYIDRLIPDTYAEMKRAIFARLDIFHTLPRDDDTYGLVHFDFSDGNYHIDMGTGKITVFDFDNCMSCWYMFDLANLWTHGVGWFPFGEAEKRRRGMQAYFDTVLEGYRSETDISTEMIDRLPLFVDMVLIENIVDEFECCHRNGREPEEEDIADEADCLIYAIPFGGFLED